MINIKTLHYQIQRMSDEELGRFVYERFGWNVRQENHPLWENKPPIFRLYQPSGEILTIDGDAVDYEKTEEDAWKYGLPDWEHNASLIFELMKPPGPSRVDLRRISTIECTQAWSARTPNIPEGLECTAATPERAMMEIIAIELGLKEQNPIALEASVVLADE